MSELAEQLIAENLKTKNPVLDLGNCGLNGTEEELYHPLKDVTHVKTLTFSGNWEIYHAKKQNWVSKFSKNDFLDPINILLKIPDTLPKNLQELILSGEMEFDRYDMSFIDYQFKIKDFSVLTDLKNLKTLDLSYGNIEDISFLKNLEKLQYLNLGSNAIKNIEVLKRINSLKAIKVDLQHLPYPPIWLTKLIFLKGKMGDYIQLIQLPQVEKIWQLMRSNDEKNMELAYQLALGQGWTEEEFEMYKNLL